MTEEDKERKEFVELKNNADNMVYSLEKMVKENGDKLSDDDKNKLNEAIEKAKKEFESDDKETIQRALDELTQTSNEIFTRMYQNVKPEGGDNTDNTTTDDTTSGSDDVIIE